VTGLALYLAVYIAGNHPDISALSINVFMIVSILSGFVTGTNFYFIAHISAGKEAAVRIMELVHAKT
jgi:phage shock protein PspC (stress-responsive transcriptional regulator)